MGALMTIVCTENPYPSIPHPTGALEAAALIEAADEINGRT
jgi:hypothetical protein